MIFHTNCCCFFLQLHIFYYHLTLWLSLPYICPTLTIAHQFLSVLSNPSLVILSIWLLISNPVNYSVKFRFRCKTTTLLIKECTTFSISTLCHSFGHTFVALSLSQTKFVSFAVLYTPPPTPADSTGLQYMSQKVTNLSHAPVHQCPADSGGIWRNLVESRGIFWTSVDRLREQVSVVRKKLMHKFPTKYYALPPYSLFEYIEKQLCIFTSQYILNI